MHIVWEWYYEYNLGLWITAVPGDQPAALYLFRRFFQLNKNSLKVYLPVHFIILLHRLKTSSKSRKRLLWQFIKELFSSCMFASSFAMSIPICYTSLHLVYPGSKNTFAGLVVSFIFSWAIFFDSKSRWKEMSLWVLSQWFEGYTYSLYKRKYLPVVNKWHVNKYQIRNIYSA